MQGHDLYLEERGRGKRCSIIITIIIIISSTSAVTFISAINPRQVIKLNDPRSLDHPARKCLFIPTPFKTLYEILRRHARAA